MGTNYMGAIRNNPLAFSGRSANDQPATYSGYADGPILTPPRPDAAQGWRHQFNIRHFAFVYQYSPV
jgi:hypothetical protein